MEKKMFNTLNTHSILHISLPGTKPLIWRKVKVMPDIPLSTLYHVLRLAMGLDGSDGYYFYHHGLEICAPGPMVWKGTVSDRNVPLSAILNGDNETLIYYHGYDNWTIDIRLEGWTTDGKASPPLCLCGNRNSPPGGSHNAADFKKMLKVLADKKHIRHGETKKQVGASYDPAAFDIDGINRALSVIRRYPMADH